MWKSIEEKPKAETLVIVKLTELGNEKTDNAKYIVATYADWGEQGMLWEAYGGVVPEEWIVEWMQLPE